MTEETDTREQAPPQRLAWVVPRITRIEAGSAELTLNGTLQDGVEFMS